MLGQAVGHWNARSGGEGMNNAVTNVTGASSAIISRVSRVISREDSVLRRLLEEKAEAPTEK